MNKVITINLGGSAYQLEEDGYNALRIYLETATARLTGNPDRDEILSDIEQAIAEKFRALLGSHKNVVTSREVTAVISEMGTIEAEAGESTATGAGSRPAQKNTPKRLYRIREGAMIAGVCNGIGAYFNIDPTFVRLGFVFLTLFWGTGLLVYAVMAFTVPEARTTEEKAAASGDYSATAQEFIRRAKAGYYEAMKHFPDQKTRWKWQRRFRREMHGHARQWQFDWMKPSWPETAGPTYPGIGFALPMLSLLQGLAKILGICALISLLATGAVFGLMLPTGLPVWAAVLILALAYTMIASPLKFARRACYHGMGNPGWAWPVIFLMDAAVWLMVVATLLWLAFHYLPQLKEAIESIPQVAHQAVDDVRSWWKR
jgi:phage shock protein PspC (stress-responsive transcriptional regulator)